MNLLELKGVTKLYDKLAALDDITLSVEKGEWVSLMGPSGSGKTTLMNIIGCLDKPTKGSVILEGEDIAHESESNLTVIRREKIGLIFQQFHLIQYLSALENVMLAQYYHSLPDKEEAFVALEKVGLRERANHLANQLSGGEQQRLCIARALINYPRLILADEPTGNLDAYNEKLVMDIFSSLHKAGSTIIMVTHDSQIAQKAQRIVFLEHGKLSRIHKRMMI